MAARTHNPFGERNRGRGAVLSLSLSARRKPDSASKNREMERGCNRGSRTKRPPKLFVPLFLFFFPTLSECEQRRPPEGCLFSPSFKCVFFFTSTKQKTETAAPFRLPRRLSMKSVALSAARTNNRGEKKFRFLMD